MKAQYESPMNNGFFRASRYPLSYSGFDNVNFTNLQIIENVILSSSQCSVVSLSEEDITFNIIPNPTNGAFEIQSSFEIQLIELYDSLGKIVLRVENQTTFDISQFTNGVYFVLIEIKSRKVIRKLVKK